MSKKFLTLFAIVALLVAAMAGTAFAADDDIVGLWREYDSSIGELSGDYSVTPLEYEATAYYLEGSAVEDGFYIDLSISMDVVQDAVSFDIDFDGDYDLTRFRLFRFNNDSANIDFDVASWDVVPESFKLDIGAVDVSGDRVGASADLTVTTQAVSFAFSQDEVVLDITDTDAVEIVLEDFERYEFGTLEVYRLSGDTFVPLPEVINSSDLGNITVSFDFTTATVVISPDADKGPGEVTEEAYEFILVASNIYISDDADARVAGLSTDRTSNVLATFTVSVEDAVENLLERVGEKAADLQVGANLIRDIYGGVEVNEEFYEIMSGDVFSFEVWFLAKDVPDGNWILDRSYDGTIISADMYGGLYLGEKEAGQEWDGTDAIAMDADIVDKAHATFSFDETQFLTTMGIRGATEPDIKAAYHFAVFDDAKILALDPTDLFVWYDKEVHSGGGSGVGCDAGFGAFALLGLAGLAAILRKKD